MFYATPPSATMEEALEDFLAAYEEKPEWIENLIYIARIYLAKGDKVWDLVAFCCVFVENEIVLAGECKEVLQQGDRPHTKRRGGARSRAGSQ